MPQKVGLYRKLMTGSLIRFCLIGFSILIHYNVPSYGQKKLWAIQSLGDKLTGKQKKTTSLP